MIGGLDDGTRQEAILETNEKLEKVEGVQSALLHMPVSRKTHAQKRQSSETDVFCPHCGSHEVSRNGSARGVARFVCKDCKKSFGPNHGKITYQSNASEATWDTYLEGMVCSDTLEQLSQKCGISLATAHNWRLKVFRTILQANETASLKGIVEEDEWYLSASFKGNLKARPVQSEGRKHPRLSGVWLRRPSEVEGRARLEKGPGQGEGVHSHCNRPDRHLHRTSKGTGQCPAFFPQGVLQGSAG